MKIRILIFSLVYYPRFIGGAEIAIKEITDRISAEDIEFHMVTLRIDRFLPKYEKIGNVHVYRIGFTGKSLNPSDSLTFPLKLNKYLLPLIGFVKARTLHKKFHYDAIWSMMASYNGFAALFFKFYFPQTPFILSLQEGDPFEYIKKRVSIFHFLFKKIFIKADITQAISHYLADFAKKMGFSGAVEVVPNAVDTKHFGQIFEEEELRKLRKAFHKKDNNIFLVTTSRLVVKNAVDDIIESLQFLPPNVKLLVIGQGYEEKNLKKLSNDLGLDERVKFLGFIDHAILPKYLKISDIFIRPSISEGFGNSFVEAMAAQIPVIATPVGGIVDFLFDPEKNPDKESTGLLCNVNDPEDIAKHVRKLMENPALRRQIVLNAHKMVLEKYDWNIIAQDMKERVFNKILNVQK